MVLFIRPVHPTRDWLKASLMALYAAKASGRNLIGKSAIVERRRKPG